MRYAIVTLLFAAWLPAQAMAAETGPQLDHVQINLSDKAAMRRGAKYFVNYCLSCHSARYMRYTQLGPGLGMTDKQIEEQLIYTDRKVAQTMKVAMPAEDAKHWFGGIAPPDLSEIANIHSTDWLYTYLKSFYVDPSRPTGFNNAVFNNVAMPDVLWQLQGIQTPVYKTVSENGQTEKVLAGLTLTQPGTMTPAQYDATVKDLVTFLDYVSNPHKVRSEHIGNWIEGLLVLFTVLAYLLKREYWKDVHAPDEKHGAKK